MDHTPDSLGAGVFLFVCGESLVNYLNIDEQIELLKTKKLNFKDEKKARIILQTIGYYKLINAYKIPFINTVNSANKKTINKL